MHQGQPSTTIKTDYVLVPFNMMTDDVPVQGRALKAIPNNPFYMATAETTGEQMQAFWRSKKPTKESPAGTDPSKPYSSASLAEAIGFCNWLSEEDGLEPLYEQKEGGWILDLRKPGYRLPFDFEWEYAARFGYDFFQKDEGNDWKAMKDELDKKRKDDAEIEEMNSGLVNYYYQPSLRTPRKDREYPLGMYDLCGNAPEICMTAEKQPLQPEVVEVVDNTPVEILLKGIAYDNNNKVLSNRTLSLYDINGNKIKVINTDENGEYNFTLHSDTVLNETEKYILNINTQNIENSKNSDELIKINPIYFDYDKSVIRPDAAVELDKIVEIMNKYPNMIIELSSFTDCRGANSYNLKLSNQRAQATVDYIKKRITKPSRISGKGFGETKLLNHCDCDGNKKYDCTEEEYQQNRRSEFRIIKN